MEENVLTWELDKTSQVQLEFSENCVVYMPMQSSFGPTTSGTPNSHLLSFQASFSLNQSIVSFSPNMIHAPHNHVEISLDDPLNSKQHMGHPTSKLSATNSIIGSVTTYIV